MADQAELIQGQTPDSKEEFWFARALEQLDMPYIYQYSILGGQRLRGGYVIDFLLVATAPASTAVNLDNSYWHKQDTAEAYENARIEEYCRRHGMRYIRIPDEKIVDVESAKRIIRAEIL